ncbi:hypothetical protein [Flavobacterium muglaense]|uniref:Lipoprotein n=1 Tax=Flavobacterium muglaense TaxID=2764716 RepID=A0A923SJG2_9FLAO|nr:hypothetical protein [Flavobacterium muglaense]MBC5837641.1 hypothetical protein [Flavobacterium muglaense]MBC5844243.1 hypothetical protein [Flavobacterium muglaense]
MKLKIIRSIFCILFFCSCNQNFETLSAKNAENEVLLKKIIPNKTVKYWQIEHFPNYKTDKLDFEILFSKGNTENIAIPKSKFNLNGFFQVVIHHFVLTELLIWKMTNGKSYGQKKN